jgi:hypothetical protein
MGLGFMGPEGADPVKSYYLIIPKSRVGVNLNGLRKASALE